MQLENENIFEPSFLIWHQAFGSFQVQEIEKQYEKLNKLLKKLQVCGFIVFWW